MYYVGLLGIQGKIHDWLDLGVMPEKIEFEPGDGTVPTKPLQQLFQVLPVKEKCVIVSITKPVILFMFTTSPFLLHRSLVCYPFPAPLPLPLLLPPPTR